MAGEIEPKEGILLASPWLPGGTGIDYSAVYAWPSWSPNNALEIVSLSKSQIETMDIWSEGPIGGPVSGIYTYSGNLGEVGWRDSSFSGYAVPSAAYTGLGFLRSVYWNQIPVLSDDAQFNFQSVDVKYAVGLPNGSVLQTLSPFQTVSRSLGERLIAGAANAKVYRILNKDCRGVVVNVKFPQLATYAAAVPGRARVDYSISYRPVYHNKPTISFILSKIESIFGKIVISNGYVRSTRIDFPSNFLTDPQFIGWELKIERTTPESTLTTLRNVTYMESLTEIQGNVYTFPNSAIIRSLFDAQFFNAIPERASDVELLKVKIPGNYNPRLKTYNITGFATINSGWNGEFATGRHWTDNPAWCYYDLLTNKRYGLGKFIDPDFVDKASLYEIGKYCDVLVSDGYRGLEPRFSCNTWIASREDAYKVINDMASVFRGLTYYANGLIYATQDAPKEAGIVFTNANVEEGNFSYSTTSRKTRNSVAIIRYNDPKNFYKPAVEYVEDFESIRKYGIREIELTAFGCTSRGQAIRFGRWALLSEKRQLEFLNFVTSIGEASYLKPGDVFKVHDANRKAKRYGGRTVSVENLNSTGSNVLLDYRVDLEPNVEYKISFITPSYNYNSSQVSGLGSNDVGGINRSFLQTFNFSGFQAVATGNRTFLNLYSGFNYSDYKVTGSQTWLIDLSDLYSSYSGNRYFANSDYDYYSVVGIVEKDTNKFGINAIQYSNEKYPEIESGLLFTKTILNQNKIPGSPTNLSLNVYNIAANTKKIAYTFLANDTANTTSFKVYSKVNQFPNNSVPDNSYLINALPPNQTYGEMDATETGTFHFRVYAVNDNFGTYSPSFASGSCNIYSYEPIRDVIIGGMTVQNITGLYSGGAINGHLTVLTDNDANPTFNWQVGSNNPFVNLDSLLYRVTVIEETHGSRVPTNPFVYQETGIISPSWQFTLDKNLISSGGPYRSYKVTAEAHDASGMTSAGNRIGVNDNGWLANPNGYDIIAISNPRQTGIELKDSLLTQETGTGPFITVNTGYYNNSAYIGPNGDITIQYTSGQFDADLVGGYIYVSTGQFVKLEAAINTGYGGVVVTKNRFDFDPLLGYIYHPTAAMNLAAVRSGFVSVSFYDEIDKMLIQNNINISTGLYISNNAVVHNQIAVGSLTIANQEIHILKYFEADGEGGGGGGYGGSPINYATATVVASGNVDGVISVLYYYPASGATVNW
jgi:hypothetical protein